jgi:hypothetical protein
LQCVIEDLWSLVQDSTHLSDFRFYDIRLCNPLKLRTHFVELILRPQNAGDITPKSVFNVSKQTKTNSKRGFIWFVILSGRSDFVKTVMKIPLQNTWNSSTT